MTSEDTGLGRRLPLYAPAASRVAHPAGLRLLDRLVHALLSAPAWDAAGLSPPGGHPWGSVRTAGRS